MVINTIAIIFLITTILFMIPRYVSYINNDVPEPFRLDFFIILSIPYIILFLINLSKKKFKNKYFQIFVDIFAGIFIILSVLFYLGIFPFYLISISPAP